MRGMRREGPVRPGSFRSGNAPTSKAATATEEAQGSQRPAPESPGLWRPPKRRSNDPTEASIGGPRKLESPEPRATGAPAGGPGAAGLSARLSSGRGFDGPQVVLPVVRRPKGEGRLDLSHLPPAVDAQQSWAGREVEVSYRPPGANEAVRVRGLIVDDGSGSGRYEADGAPRSSARGKERFQVLTADGLRSVADLDTFALGEVDPKSSVPKSIEDLEARLARPTPVLATLKGASFPHAPNASPEIYVQGLASFFRTETGEPRVRIRDARGQDHLVDPRYLSRGAASFTFFERFPEALEALPGPEPALALTSMDHPERTALARELVASRRFLSGPALAAFMERDLPRARQLLESWYRTRPERLRDAVAAVTAALGERFVGLLADLGVACRWEALVAFGPGYLQRHPGVSAAELWEAFARHLEDAERQRPGGPEKQFRGVALDDATFAAKAVRERGLQGAFFEGEGPDAPSSVEASARALDPRPYDEHDLRLSWERSSNPVQELAMRRGGQQSVYRSSPLQSLSGHPDLAASVGWAAGYRRFNQARLFLFELQIPPIHVITLTGLLAEPPTADTVEVGGRVYGFADPKVESFVSGRIEPEWIREVYRYDVPPPSPREVRVRARAGTGSPTR